MEKRRRLLMLALLCAALIISVFGLTACGHAHAYDKEVATETYLKTAATCTESAVYYKSCECGEKGTETFTYGKALGHNYIDTVCSRCGIEDYEKTMVFELNNDTYTLVQYKGKLLYVMIPAEYKGLPVTKIGSGAFMGRSSILGITIPDSVTSIGSGAFDYCSSLHYNIKDKLKYLGNENNPYVVVMGVTDNTLSSYTIESSAKFIYGSAFNGCSSLTSITIPDSVTSIERYAFSGCSSLASITIPNSVTRIEEWTFAGCGLLTNVTIGNGVTSIEEWTFAGCSSLASITIPDSITSIGSSAFSGCSSLTSITIPDSVTSIEWDAFHPCDSLESIYYIGDINNWVEIDGLNNLMGYGKSVKKLYIQGELLTEANITTATKISDSAFVNCSSLKSVTIGNSVTSIGSGAFGGCSSLASITIPDSVTSIGSGAFYNCILLKSVTIPDSVTSIGNEAFDGCSSLENIYYTGDINSWVGKINGLNRLMVNGKSDKKLYIQGELLTEAKITTATKINGYAFYNCSSLTSITIPDNVMSIGYAAFWHCKKLVEVINKSSLYITKGSSDYGYVGENALTVHNGESKIVNKDGYLFITYDRINYLVNYVGNETKLTLPDNYNGENYIINKYAFRNCSSLTSIIIPDSVTSIGSYAFWDCSSLTSITIPDSVTSIGVFAFRDCSSLTSVTIGNGVTSIGSGAFASCSSLKDITFNGTRGQWNSISKGNNWNSGTGDYTVHCTDGDIKKEKN